jgi:hypothetical protein
MHLERGIASAAYYVLLVLVGIAFFDMLKLQLVSGPLQALVGEVFNYLPRLGAGAALLFVAWIVATIARNLLTRGLKASGLDERLAADAGMRPISQSLGDMVYWLVILLLVPAVLGTLQLQGMLGPVEAMVNDILGMLPNVLAAGVIALVGWGLAVIVRNLVTNLLAGTGADRAGEAIDGRAKIVAPEDEATVRQAAAEPLVRRADARGRIRPDLGQDRPNALPDGRVGDGPQHSGVVGDLTDEADLAASA